MIDIKQILAIYQKAINNLDDFFEYHYNDYSVGQIREIVQAELTLLNSKLSFLLGKSDYEPGTCEECGGLMKSGGIALEDVLEAGMPDFIGQDKNEPGITLSPQGKVRLIQVWKCRDCGHSIKQMRGDVE